MLGAAQKCKLHRNRSESSHPTKKTGDKKGCSGSRGKTDEMDKKGSKNPKRKNCGSAMSAVEGQSDSTRV